MTDTELLDWFDFNGVESGFAISTPDGEAVIVSGVSIRDMLLTAMALRGSSHDIHEAHRLVNQMELDNRSLIKLDGLHDHLKVVISRAAEISDMDFIVTEGLRTEKRQAELVAAGASRTMNSRHLTGHAVDLAVKVGREVRWDWPLYSRLAAIVKDAAEQMGVPIEWGGDWRSFKDGPHFQLPFKDYPA